MKSLLFRIFAGVLVAGCAFSSPGAEKTKAKSSRTRITNEIWSVEYPPSTKTNELQIGVTYTLWMPAGIRQVRGIIVHQHGCGSGACKGGETAAFDLHWQALARKHSCALLGPSYHQDDKQNCRLWCDPRNGSAQTFLKALSDLAVQSNHPEIKEVPWCLWGHSGGGFWGSLMQTMYPERIVAMWFRSGTAYSAWEKGEIPKPEIPEAVYQIPMMCNPGVKEKGDQRFNGAWTGTMDMFKAYRAKGGLIGFAPDPRTSHETGDSRYLAIPFFDTCLEWRLPNRGTNSQALKPAKLERTWLAPLLGDTAVAAAEFKGDTNESVWLPGSTVARAWSEYVKTGATIDTTPPPPVVSLRVKTNDGGGILITWEANVDLESGLSGFIILRNGEEIAKLPEKPVGKFGRPLFQTMSYHDTPERPLPETRYLDKTAKPGEKYSYNVLAVNTAGLKSNPGATALIK